MSNFNSLYSFDNPYPKKPEAALIEYKGLLYGTTSEGGTSSQGTVFTYDPNTKTVQVVYNFRGGEDGAGPAAALVEYKGLLYGTTFGGGTAGEGTLFTYDPNTKTTEVVYQFRGGEDGALPAAALIEYKGLLYGTTSEGGTSSESTVFTYDPNTKTKEVVYNFRGGEDGALPAAALVEYKGLLYGTTSAGGTAGQGTMFMYDPNKNTTEIVYNFRGGEDGSRPYAALIEYKGLLYGTTSEGGTAGQGTVFTYDPTKNTTEVVYSFQGGEDGSNSIADLVEYKGLLYGITSEGGRAGQGTVFTYDPNTKTTQVVYQFQGREGGSRPYAALIEYKGLLYGTTSEGGTAGTGTLFTYDPNTKTTQVVYQFLDREDGSRPNAALVEYKSVLYGTTSSGGEKGKGKVGTNFSVTFPSEKEVENFREYKINVNMSLKISFN